MLKIAAAVTKQIQGLANPAVTRRYKLEGTIAKGSTSQVKQATDRKTGQTVAVKIIDLAAFEGAKRTAKLQIEREIDIMMLIDHPHCVKLFEVYKSQERIYLAMEFMSGGELFSRIMTKEHYTEEAAAKCFQQIMGAIAYLHAMGIAHRDLKPENIMYVSPDEDSPVKIVDFGLGKIIDFEGDVMRTMCGTPHFVAPEVIACRMKPGSSGTYDQSCDVWSAGVILYCMLSGEYPFTDDSGLIDMFTKISRGSYWFPPRTWHKVSNEAKDLVRAMMTVEVKRRVTAAGCLAHPWFARCQQGAAPSEDLTDAQAKLRDRHEALAKRKLLGVGAAPAPPGADAPPPSAAGARAGAAAAAAAAATPVGCLLARGEGLEIVSINGYARQLLACAADPAPAPRAVRDVLDPAFADAHGQFLARAVREGRLPASIQHPLRNIPLRRRDGTTTQVELLVGALDEHAALGADTLFFAYFVPSSAFALAGGGGGAGDRGGGGGGGGGGAGDGDDGRVLTLKERMQTRFGGAFASMLLRGAAPPPPDEFVEATVACFSLPAALTPQPRAGMWGSGSAGAAGGFDLLGIAARHRISVMGCRVGGGGGDDGGGERVMCVAGTNHVRGDLSFDQAERMVNFLAEVVAALGKRRIRVGVATGPLSVSVDLVRPSAGAATPGGDSGSPGGDGAAAAALRYQASGAAAEEAARLEATGREGFLHLSLAAADRLGEERGLFLDLGEHSPPGPGSNPTSPVGSPSGYLGGAFGGSFSDSRSARRRGSVNLPTAAPLTAAALRRCSLPGSPAGYNFSRRPSSASSGNGAAGSVLPRAGSAPSRAAWMFGGGDGAGGTTGGGGGGAADPAPSDSWRGSEASAAATVSVWIDCFRPDEVFVTEKQGGPPAE